MFCGLFQPHVSTIPLTDSFPDHTFGSPLQPPAFTKFWQFYPIASAGNLTFIFRCGVLPFPNLFPGPIGFTIKVSFDSSAFPISNNHCPNTGPYSSYYWGLCLLQPPNIFPA